jgi:hypothetical protein
MFDAFNTRLMREEDGLPKSQGLPRQLLSLRNPRRNDDKAAGFQQLLKTFGIRMARETATATEASPVQASLKFSAQRTFTNKHELSGRIAAADGDQGIGEDICAGLIGERPGKEDERSGRIKT